MLLAEKQVSVDRKEKSWERTQDTDSISAYLQGSCRKSEVMRTPEHKRSVKNGANSDSVKTGSEMRDNAKMKHWSIKTTPNAKLVKGWIE